MISFPSFQALLAAAMLVGLIAHLIPAWAICRRAGHTGTRSLWILVPIANLIAVYRFARRPRRSSHRAAQ